MGHTIYESKFSVFVHTGHFETVCVCVCVARSDRIRSDNSWASCANNDNIDRMWTLCVYVCTRFYCFIWNKTKLACRVPNGIIGQRNKNVNIIVCMKSHRTISGLCVLCSVTQHPFLWQLRHMRVIWLDTSNRIESMEQQTTLSAATTTEHSMEQKNKMS